MPTGNTGIFDIDSIEQMLGQEGFTEFLTLLKNKVAAQFALEMKEARETAVRETRAAGPGGARMVLDMPMLLEQHLNRHYDQWWTDPSFIHKDLAKHHPEAYVRYKTREGKIGWQSSIDRDYRRTTRGLRDESGRVWETRSSLLTKEEGIAA